MNTASKQRLAAATMRPAMPGKLSRHRQDRPSKGFPYVGLLCALTVGPGCAGLLMQGEARKAHREVPKDWGIGQPAPSSGKPADGTPIAHKTWRAFFSSPHLQALIGEALKNNQELNILAQEIVIARAEIGARRGAYLPKLEGELGAGVEKVGEHTSQGIGDDAHGIPANLEDFKVGLTASWEIDVWGKLRNAAKAADFRYLSGIEARNFAITALIAEIASSYYELLALDNQLDVVKRNIAIQESALDVVRQQKAAGRATQLAVQKFEAEVLKNNAHAYALRQQQVTVENRLNMLAGRYPQPIERDPQRLDGQAPAMIAAGLPAQLLQNRPDVRQAEMQLEAAKLDVRVAKARFFPSLSLRADVGYRSFNSRHILETPQSMAYNLVGNLVAPLLNRAEIVADYRSANAEQIRAVLAYERTLLRAFTDVVTHLAMLDNLRNQYERQSQQVETLHQAIEVSNVLYRSARADYMEVLMTRRDSLEAEMEFIETKRMRMQAVVKVYQALGGGWRRTNQDKAS